MKCQWCGRDNAHKYKTLNLCWICYHKKQEDEMETKYDYANPIDLGWLGKKTYKKKDGTEGVSFDGKVKIPDGVDLSNCKVQASAVKTKYGQKLKLTAFPPKDDFEQKVKETEEVFNASDDEALF